MEENLVVAVARAVAKEVDVVVRACREVVRIKRI
jgi:hypothetical protein